MSFSRNFAYIVSAAMMIFGPASADTATVHRTPQDALTALVTALETGTVESVLAAVDPGALDLVEVQDPDERKEAYGELVALYREGYRFVPQEDGSVEIALGEEGWPFPIALVPVENGWTYDIETAREEISDRLVGENELAMIDVMEGYVEIQTEFRSVDHDGDGVMEFAAHVISDADARDGLYWPADDSPTSEQVARASLDGISEDGEDRVPEPFNGYYLRVLNAQGSRAPGGEMSYVVNGNQVAGHALLAVPADYGVTGIMSFMVAENGNVLEADLGEDTLDMALDIFAYDPGPDWSTAE